MSTKPQIAAFPKGWIKDLVAPDKLSIYEWVDMAGAPLIGPRSVSMLKQRE